MFFSVNPEFPEQDFTNNFKYQEHLSYYGDKVVIKGEGYLKRVPKKKIDLTKCFDRADLGMNIEDWDEFERR